MKKVKFTRDYHPRKKEDVAELEDDLATFYLNNGIAELENKPKEKGCTECQDKAEAKINELEAELTEVKEALKVKTVQLDEANAKILKMEEVKKTIKKNS